MRDWLTVIIILLIVGIVLDGFRRMRAYRRDALRMSKKITDTDSSIEDDLSGSEFPSGGARVAGYRDPEALSNVNQNVRENYVQSKVTRGAPNRTPEQESLNLDAPVPMLMESVEDAEDPIIDRDREPQLGSLDDLDDEVAENTEPNPDYSGEQVAEEPESEPEPLKPAPKQVQKLKPKISAPHNAESNKTEPVKNQLPDEVLVINVMARSGEFFDGESLLEVLLSCGLRFGDMDIFHRHETPDGKGSVLFSLANIVMPGTFDLDTMDQFSSPGVSLFLSLPIKSDSIAAYGLMAETAWTISETLGGELKDENRSVMTRQTIEHDRQRVVEYERKRRLAKA